MKLGSYKPPTMPQKVAKISKGVKKSKVDLVHAKKALDNARMMFKAGKLPVKRAQKKAYDANCKLGVV